MKDVPLKAGIDLVKFLVSRTRPPFSDPTGDFLTHRLVPLVLSGFLVLGLPAFRLSILETYGTRLRRVGWVLPPPLPYSLEGLRWAAICSGSVGIQNPNRVLHNAYSLVLVDGGVAWLHNCLGGQVAP